MWHVCILFPSSANLPPFSSASTLIIINFLSVIRRSRVCINFFHRSPDGFGSFGERGSESQYNQSGGRQRHSEVPGRCATSRHNIWLVQKCKLPRISFPFVRLTIEFGDNEGDKRHFSLHSVMISPLKAF